MAEVLRSCPLGECFCVKRGHPHTRLHKACRNPLHRKAKTCMASALFTKILYSLRQLVAFLRPTAVQRLDFVASTRRTHAPQIHLSCSETSTGLRKKTALHTGHQRRLSNLRTRETLCNTGQTITDTSPSYSCSAPSAHSDAHRLSHGPSSATRF